ncbi:hypothetical protein GJU35_14130 [Streptomyces lincolnensis]|nr:hypothetical protein GJU35_14130 [Streptomyces lincolnensis]
MDARVLSVSLDECLAGPDSGRGHPPGVGGERLHRWVFGLRSWRAEQGLDGGKGGPVDELWLHVVPVFLGGGRRLPDGVADEGVEWRRAEVPDTPEAAHIRLRMA